MTSLADREHAIEAYFAMTALSSFNQRVRRRKALMTRLISGAGLHGAEAKALFTGLLGRCASACPDSDLTRAIIAELAARGVIVSPDEMRKAETRRSAGTAGATLPAAQPWVAYLAEQLMSLFDGRDLARSPRQTRPDHRAASYGVRDAV